MADLDFYTRQESSSEYVNDILEVSDERSILIEQIENILFTRKGDVLGQPDFGVNLEDLLFTLTRNQSEIKSSILNQIYSYCPLALKYSVDVDVTFKKTVNRDLGFIDIIINDQRLFGVLI